MITELKTEIEENIESYSLYELEQMLLLLESFDMLYYNKSYVYRNYTMKKEVNKMLENQMKVLHGMLTINYK